MDPLMEVARHNLGRQQTTNAARNARGQDQATSESEDDTRSNVAGFGRKRVERRRKSVEGVAKGVKTAGWGVERM